MPGMAFIAISFLKCRIKISPACANRPDLAFTMSTLFAELSNAGRSQVRMRLFCRSSFAAFDVSGGANRDRTDDLKLAKLALSQLSYGPFELRTRSDGGPGTS